MSGRYRYLLDHPISLDELEPLQSGLEDEQEFRLAELVGAPRLGEMLDRGYLSIDLTVEERFFAFGPAIRILSVYLPEYVSGVEVVEELDFTHRCSRIECWRYVGRGGDLLTVPLQYALSIERAVVVGREDPAVLRRMWAELPQWARDGYKLSFGELADLDAGG